MPEEKKRSGRKVNAWIQDDLYSMVDDLKYRTWTEAIVSGLELLVGSTTSGQSEVQDQNNEVHKSTEQSTLDDSKVLRVQLMEMQEHIETLKLDLDRSNKNADDIKEMYMNHVLQVQSLINQRGIEALGVKKPWWRFW
jgi:TolA-binding protein